MGIATSSTPSPRRTMRRTASARSMHPTRAKSRGAFRRRSLYTSVAINHVRDCNPRPAIPVLDETSRQRLTPCRPRSYGAFSAAWCRHRRAGQLEGAGKSTSYAVFMLQAFVCVPPLSRQGRLAMLQFSCWPSRAHYRGGVRSIALEAGTPW